MLLRRELLDDLFVFGEHRIVLRRIGHAGPRRAQIFMASWADKDKAHLPIRARLHDEIHQREQFGAEFRGTVLQAIADRIGIQHGIIFPISQIIEARRHAVAEDRDCRLHHGELFLQRIFALRDRIEACARRTERAVAAIAEIPHREIAPGKFAPHPRLDDAVIIFTLHEHIADEQHAVAVLDVELSFGSGKGEAHRCYEADDGEDARDVHDAWEIEEPAGEFLGAAMARWKCLFQITMTKACGHDRRRLNPRCRIRIKVSTRDNAVAESRAERCHRRRGSQIRAFVHRKQRDVI